MKKYCKSVNDLESLKINIKNRKLISDEKVIQQYDNLLLSKESLPANIEKEEKTKKQLTDVDFIPEELPVNIETGPIEVIDKEEISKIREYVRKNNVYPEGVKRIYRKDSIKGEGEVFLREVENAYYQIFYDYYDVKYLDDEIVDFQLKVKDAKSLNSIAESLLFFKILTIVVISLNILLVLIFLL